MISTSMIATLLGNNLPASIIYTGPYGDDGITYKTLSSSPRAGLRIIESLFTHTDGHQWLHVSFSYKNKMPTYEDMTFIKRIFIGDDRKAIMVFPEKENHVSIHNYCLHFWHCVDGDPIPEFSKAGSI
jgi:hypothetical protein